MQVVFGTQRRRNEAQFRDDTEACSPFCLERSQQRKRCHRYVVNNWLGHAGSRRKVSRTVLLFKLYHDDSRHDTENIIRRPDYIGRNDHPKKIRRIQSRLLLYHNSFFPKTIREWNQIHINLAAIETLSDFKAML